MSAQCCRVVHLFDDSECVAQRHGTCEDTLLRVLVSRSEVDLKKILEQYSAMYDLSLQEHIQVMSLNCGENNTLPSQLQNA